jgi:hypothetical protein
MQVDPGEVEGAAILFVVVVVWSVVLAVVLSLMGY